MKVCQCGSGKFAKKDEYVQYNSPSGSEDVKELVHTCMKCGERYVRIGKDYDIRIKYEKE